MQLARFMSTTSRVRIYTRTGDKGTSSLYSGERRRKDDDIFEALGTADELNAHLGVSVAELGTKHVKLAAMLTECQSRLLDLGSCIATPPASSSEHRLARVALPIGLCEQLENWIDDMEEQLPPLKNFILPGGSRTSAALHVARTVCRRLERCLARIPPDYLDASVFPYVNRLSDFLFVAARMAAQIDGATETIYQKKT